MAPTPRPARARLPRPARARLTRAHRCRQVGWPDAETREHLLEHDELWQLEALQREQARALLSSVGEEVEVADEGYLDMATAIVGSGPAYTFLFIESMIDTGVHMGFPRDVAQKLVLKTVADFFLRNTVLFLGLKPVGDLLEVATRAAVP